MRKLLSFNPWWISIQNCPELNKKIFTWSWTLIVLDELGEDKLLKLLEKWSKAKVEEIWWKMNKTWCFHKNEPNTDQTLRCICCFEVKIMNEWWNGELVIREIWSYWYWTAKEWILQCSLQITTICFLTFFMAGVQDYSFIKIYG